MARDTPWTTGIINLRISAGSRGLLSDSLMSSNKNNDLTRCNCYCNNSWTCRILITGHSQPWRHYIVTREPSLLRHGATCQGPGPALIRQGLPGVPEDSANIQCLRRGERGMRWGGGKEGWGFRLPRLGDQTVFMSVPYKCTINWPQPSTKKNFSPIPPELTDFPVCTGESTSACKGGSLSR